MLSSLSLPILALIFVAVTVAVWNAGIKLSDTSDVLSDRLGLGEALGGLILLAIATNVPEIAITASATLRQDLGIATGNILGRIAISPPIPINLITILISAIGGVVGWLIILILHLLGVAFV